MTAYATLVNASLSVCLCVSVVSAPWSCTKLLAVVGPLTDDASYGARIALKYNTPYYQYSILHTPSLAYALGENR